MLFALGSNIPSAIQLHVLGLIFAITLMSNAVASQYEFDACELPNRGTGICRVFEECQELVDKLKRHEITINDPARCGFKGAKELICCPGSGGNIGSRDGKPAFEPNKVKPVTQIISPPSTEATKRPTTITRTERPSVAACRAIEEGLNPVLTPHILDGTPVSPGEYPHMAAIGYPSIGNEPYDFRCGGTLIHERFVLTAAHCVNTRNITPSIVRLGMANFDDPEELSHRVDMPVKAVFIHPNYSNSRKYDDIALLELQNSITPGEFIYPTCLYTDLDDPPSDSKLYVSGWGTVNTRTRMNSRILLKARLQIEPLDNCNSSYVEYGLTRQLDRALERTQICAHDPGFSKDACQGDSGGPLLMVEDESTKNFRIIGVISTGFGCATAIPGIYTRVAAYLDFIENIVWPTL